MCVVLSGGDEYDATKGTLGIYFDDVWRIGSLSPGESVDIDINYYKLLDDGISHYAQVSFSAEDDPDSTPNNGICCQAVEDDEVSLLANGVAGRNADNTSQQRNVSADVTIYPNPTTGEEVFLLVNALEDQQNKIYIYDILGKRVVEQSPFVYQGANKIRLETQMLKEGMYLVVLQDQNLQTSTTKFIIEK